MKELELEKIDVKRSETDKKESNLFEFQLRVINSEAEGECKVKSIDCLRLENGKIFVFLFMFVFSFGLWGLLVKWFLPLKRFCLYTECSLEEATHFLITGTDGTITIEDRVDLQLEDGSTTICFMNNLMKYIYLPDYKSFKALEFFDFNNLSYKDLISQYALGVSEHASQKRLSIYGKCMLDIPIPGMFNYLANELIGPFYILQYFSVVLWIAEKAYIYSILLLGLTIILTIVNYCFVRNAAEKIRDIAFSEIKIKIMRKGDKNCKDNDDTFYSDNLINTESTLIIPGDVIVIDEGVNAAPCDCVLISGEVLMNESMLNGESTPIPKFPIVNKQDLFNFKDGKRHILFEGTKVLESKPTEHKYVLAIALRTGFTTLKGQLVRTVIFPKAAEDIFSKQVMKFIISYGIVCIIVFIPMIIKMISFDLPIILYIYRVFDIILWIIPPTLPIYLSFCITIALIRLKGNQVLGLQPQKIVPAGQVTTVCFDKTGTLTKNEIEVFGYIECQNKILGNMVLAKDISDHDKKEKFIFKFFATCHGVYRLNNKLQGDSLDIEMLKYSKWELVNSTDSNTKFISCFENDKNSQLEVKKVFEFASEHQRLSVVTLDTATNKVYVFSKGAPEKIHSMCRPETVSDKFHEILEKMAMRGYRILGLGYKEIDSSTIEPEKIKFYERDDAESDLIFSGFLILENKLKDDTSECIQRLTEADIQIKIISGDNPLTTVQASREANIINNKSIVYLCDIETDGVQENPNVEITYKLIHPVAFEEESEKEIMIKINTEHKPEILDKIEYLQNKLLSYGDEEFAITGPLFEYCYNTVYTKNKIIKEKKEKIKEFFNILVKRCKIFSRMKPEQKAMVVEELQKTGIRTGMVGDGANDCSALKQADVGISFSEADASFCAPFSSLTTSIVCVERVLLEGKATLLNNVEVFRFVMAIAFFKYVSSVILTYSLCYISDFQFIYINFFSSVPTLVLIGFSAPLKVLSSKKVPEDLVGLVNILSIYGQLCIGGIGLVVSYLVLQKQQFYQTFLLTNSPKLVDDYYNTKGPENTTLFLVMNIYFLMSIFAFVYSSPFKRRIWFNYPLSSWILISLIYNTIIIFLPGYAIGAMNILTDMDNGFYTIIFFLAYGFGLLMILYEELFMKILISSIWDKYQREQQMIRNL